MPFCERRLRDIEPWECDKWSCKYWVRNGGYCFGVKEKRERRDPPLIIVGTILPENVLKRLKKKARATNTKEALRIAVEHYLRCPTVIIGEEGKCRICGRPLTTRARNGLCSRCLRRIRRARRW